MSGMEQLPHSLICPSTPKVKSNMKQYMCHLAVNATRPVKLYEKKSTPLFSFPFSSLSGKLAFVN